MIKPTTVVVKLTLYTVPLSETGADSSRHVKRLSTQTHQTAA